VPANILGSAISGRLASKQSEAILFNQIENLIEGARAFIIVEPILFVLVSGLIIAVVSVVGETVTYWAARLGGRDPGGGS